MARFSANNCYFQGCGAGVRLVETEFCPFTGVGAGVEPDFENDELDF